VTLQPGDELWLNCSYDSGNPVSWYITDSSGNRNRISTDIGVTYPYQLIYLIDTTGGSHNLVGFGHSNISAYCGTYECTDNADKAIIIVSGKLHLLQQEDQS